MFSCEVNMELPLKYVSGECELHTAYIFSRHRIFCIRYTQVATKYVQCKHDAWMLSMFVDTLIPQWEVRKYSQWWKKWSTKRHFDWLEKICTGRNSQTWPKVCHLWNSGSFGRYTQYRSFPHNCTTCSCHRGLHKSLCKIYKQLTDENIQPRVDTTQKFLAQHTCDLIMILCTSIGDELQILYSPQRGRKAVNFGT